MMKSLTHSHKIVELMTAHPMSAEVHFQVCQRRIQVRRTIEDINEKRFYASQDMFNRRPETER